MGGQQSARRQLAKRGDDVFAWLAGEEGDAEWLFVDDKVARAMSESIHLRESAERANRTGALYRRVRVDLQTVPSDDGDEGLYLRVAASEGSVFTQTRPVAGDPEVRAEFAEHLPAEIVPLEHAPTDHVRVIDGDRYQRVHREGNALVMYVDTDMGGILIPHHARVSEDGEAIEFVSMEATEVLRVANDFVAAITGKNGPAYLFSNLMHLKELEPSQRGELAAAMVENVPITSATSRLERFSP
jgi:hypothetical protein